MHSCVYNECFNNEQANVFCSLLHISLLINFLLFIISCEAATQKNAVKHEFFLIIECRAFNKSSHYEALAE